MWFTSSKGNSPSDNPCWKTETSYCTFFKLNNSWMALYFSIVCLTSDHWATQVNLKGSLGCFACPVTFKFQLHRHYSWQLEISYYCCESCSCVTSMLLPWSTTEGSMDALYISCHRGKCPCLNQSVPQRETLMIKIFKSWGNEWWRLFQDMNKILEVSLKEIYSNSQESIYK